MVSVYWDVVTRNHFSTMYGIVFWLSVPVPRPEMVGWFPPSIVPHTCPKMPVDYSGPYIL